MITPAHEARIEALAVKDAEITVDDLRAQGDDLSKYTPGCHGEEEECTGLINAIGGEETAKYFGVALRDADGSLSDDFCAACDVYNRAFRDAVEFEKQEKQGLEVES